MKNFIYSSDYTTLLGSMFSRGIVEYFSKDDIIGFLTKSLNEDRRMTKDVVYYQGDRCLTESAKNSLALAVVHFGGDIFGKLQTISDVVMLFESQGENFVVSVDFPYVAFKVNSMKHLSPIKDADNFIFRNPRYDEHRNVPKESRIKDVVIFYGMPDGLKFSCNEIAVFCLPKGRGFIQSSECVPYAMWAVDKDAMYNYDGLFVLGDSINKFIIDHALSKAGVEKKDVLHCLKIRISDDRFVLVPTAYPKLAFEFNYIHEANKIADGYEMNLAL